METKESTPLTNLKPKHEKEKVGGYTVLVATIFVIGEMAGSGVIAIPKAIVDTGIFGFILMILCCLMAAFTGSLLGKCWTILQERFEIYNKCTRDPYPAIAYESFGTWGRNAVSVCNNFTCFGATVVYLLLSSEIIQGLVLNTGVNVSPCYWVLIIAVLITPFTWLGTPKDMWLLAVAATSTTLVAMTLITVKLIIILPTLPTPKHTSPIHKPDGFTGFMLGLGVVLSAFGNHFLFPTVQHDMKDPEKFSRVVYLAFIVILLMYLPVGVFGYVAFGDSVNDNVLTMIQNTGPGPTIIIVQSLLGLHLLCTLVLLINPVCLELEERFNIPHDFNWKRVVIRSIVMCLVVFVAESIPRFGVILSLIGGSTVSALSFVFPTTCYIKLCRMKGDFKERKIHLYQYVICGIILVFAVVAMVTTTYSAISNIVGRNTFIPPCYINTNISSQVL